MTRTTVLVLLTGAVFLLTPGSGAAQASGNAQAVRSQIVHQFAAATTSRDIAKFHTRSSQNPRGKTSDWVSFDKVQHVTFGFLFTIGYQYTLVNKLDMTEQSALPLAIGGALAVGLAKEVYDLKVGPRKKFEKHDLVADAIGILLAAALISI